MKDLKVTLKPEAIQIALKELDKFVKRPMGTAAHSWGTGGDSGRYGAVCLTPDDKLRAYANTFPCHRYMGDYKNPIVIFNQYSHRPAFLKVEADRMFFDWIMSESSPWKSFGNRVVTEGGDTEWIFNNGWVWSDLTYPSNLQHNFLVASRMPSEWPHYINRWYDYVTEYKLDKTMAFVFLDVFTPVVNDETKFVINHKNKYDWPIDVCSSGEEYIRNFMSGTVEALNKPYGVDPSYRPVNRIFGNNILGVSNPETYVNQVYERYNKTFGPGESACQEYWSKKGTGMSEFKRQDHWFVYEPELIEICGREYERLKMS